MNKVVFQIEDELRGCTKAHYMIKKDYSELSNHANQP